MYEVIINSRQKKIKEYIRLNKNVTVNELIERFQVSDMTIRRDLILLEKLGFLKKIHGGAIFQEESKEDIWLSVRQQSNNIEKELIAEKAVSFVKEGDTIILDAGSTTNWIARKLLKFRNITVVTNAINIASILSANMNIEIVMTGGDVRHSTQSLVGPATEEFLKSLQANFVFLGCGAISLEYGLMNSNMIEGEVKRAMMNSASNVCLVADITKFKQKNPFIFSTLDNVDTLITNSGLDNEILEKLKDFDHLKLHFA